MIHRLDGFMSTTSLMKSPPPRGKSAGIGIGFADMKWTQPSKCTVSSFAPRRHGTLNLRAAPDCQAPATRQHLLELNFGLSRNGIDT